MKNDPRTPGGFARDETVEFTGRNQRLVPGAGGSGATRSRREAGATTSNVQRLGKAVNAIVRPLVSLSRWG